MSKDLKDEAKYLQLPSEEIQQLTGTVEQIHHRTNSAPGFYGEPLADVKGLGLAQAVNTKAVDTKVEDRYYIGPIPQLANLPNEPKTEPAEDDEKQLLSPKEKYIEFVIMEDAKKINDICTQGAISGGTSAQWVAIDAEEKQVIWGNVGDGRIILFTLDDKKVEIECKNKLHNLENKEEKARIKQAKGNIIENRLSVASADEEGFLNCANLEELLNYNMVEQLKVTRSLGDVIFIKSGLSFKPQINSFAIDPIKDQLVVICSDGFDEAKLVKEHSEEFQALLLKIFKSTADTATKASWLISFGKKYSIDDGTLILIEVKTFCKQKPLPPPILITVFDGHRGSYVADLARVLTKERLDVFRITQPITLWDALKNKNSAQLRFLLTDKENFSDPLWNFVPHEKFDVDAKDSDSRTALEIVLLAKWKETEKGPLIKALTDNKASKSFFLKNKSNILDSLLSEAKVPSGKIAILKKDELPKSFSKFCDEISKKPYVYYLSVAACFDVYNVLAQSESKLGELKSGTKEKIIAHLKYLGEEVDESSIGVYNNNQGYAFFSSDTEIPKTIENIIKQVDDRTRELSEIDDLISETIKKHFSSPIINQIKQVEYSFRKHCAQKDKGKSLEQFHNYLTTTQDFVSDEKILPKLKMELISEVKAELRLSEFEFFYFLIKNADPKFNPSQGNMTLHKLKRHMRTCYKEGADKYTILNQLMHYINTYISDIETKPYEDMLKEFKDKFFTHAENMIALKSVDCYIQNKINEVNQRGLIISTLRFGGHGIADEKTTADVQETLKLLKIHWEQICCSKDKESALNELIENIKDDREETARYDTHLEEFAEQLIAIANEELLAARKNMVVMNC